jgi:methyl-accepting chemotaxis protein
MSFYNNLRIGTKLISGFVIIALVFGAVGIYTMHMIKMLDDSDTAMYEDMTVPLAIVGELSTQFNRIRVDARDVIMAQAPEEIQNVVDKVKADDAKLDQLAVAFEKTIGENADMQTQFAAYTAAEKIYSEEMDKIVALSVQNRDAEASLLIASASPAAKALAQEQEAINNMVTMKTTDAKAKSDSNTVQAERTMKVMKTIIFLIMILAVLLGIFISSTITKPCKKAVHMLEEMSKGHFGERLHFNRKDEIGKMTHIMDYFADELQNKVIGVMNMISEGDVSVNIELKDEKDEIAPAMKRTVETIRSLKNDINDQIDAIREGKLDSRGDSAGYSGSWQELVEGINSLVDALVSPINITAEYVERISKGDIPDPITEDYRGDFNEIKNNINGCIEVMNELLSDTAGLIQSAQDGKLDVRGDASVYRGEWSTLMNEINNLIDAFVAPINVTAEYVERISRGDIPDRITEDYKGDFNEIKNSINGCIDVMNELLTETGSLTDAIRNGKLDARGDSSPYKGEWKTLLEGINHLIDAFVAPINVTAEYIERISNGDIPELITEEYRGDFNEIKNNLNQCIKTMSGLTAETTRLIGAAQKGALDERADLAAVSGRWKELLGGMNSMLEAIVTPIKEVTAAMKQISQGNLKAAVSAEYEGEFEILSGAVNSTARDLNAVVNEISSIIGEISGGNLKLEKVRTYRGDFISISNSLNAIVDSLNDVLNEINIASDEVSVGSKQVSDGSQALSQGTTEQASAIEQLNASVAEVAAKTKENASSANHANSLTDTVKTHAEQGNVHMKEMLDSMEEINQSSTNISQIIKVIDDIAFQTNILALNAAVEAARAGQHGKGFAVVAEEVRNLAARSAAAARETTDLIQGSMEKSQKGTGIAQNTAQALYEIVEGVSKTSQIISEIAQSSNEQATGISQINVGLSQVAQVVQNNAATAQQSAASSEELSSQAELLKQMVARFRLRQGTKSLGAGAVKLLNDSVNQTWETGFEEFASKKVAIELTGSDKY